MARPVTGCVGFAKTAGDGGGSGRASATSQSHRGQTDQGEPRDALAAGRIDREACGARPLLTVPPVGGGSPDAGHPVMYLMPAGTTAISNTFRVIKAPIATGDTAGLRPSRISPGFSLCPLCGP